MRTDMKYIDSLSGRQFEKWVYKLAKMTDPLNKNYIKLTPASDDFGIDVISSDEGIQCKHVTGSIVGYRAVEEAVAGTKYYGLTTPVVITNGLFSNHAKKGAKKSNVLLVNRDKLQPFVKCIENYDHKIKLSVKYQSAFLSNRNLSRIRSIQQRLGIKDTVDGFNEAISEIIDFVEAECDD